MSKQEVDPLSADHNFRDRIKKEIRSQLRFPVEWGSLMEGEGKPAPCIEDEIARKQDQLRQMKEDLRGEKLSETEIQQMTQDPHSLDDKYVSPTQKRKQHWKKLQKTRLAEGE